MANHPSAEKRNRQNLKRRERNSQQRAAIRTAIKSARALAEKGDIEGAEKAAKTASKLLDKAAVRNLHHRNNASRRISRLYAHIRKSSEVSATA